MKHTLKRSTKTLTQKFFCKNCESLWHLDRASLPHCNSVGWKLLSKKQGSLFFSYLQGAIFSGEAGYQHCLWCLQLLLRRSSRQEWPSGGSPLSLPKPHLQVGGSTLGVTLLRILGPQLLLMPLIRQQFKTKLRKLGTAVLPLSEGSQLLMWGCLSAIASTRFFQSQAQRYAEKQTIKETIPNIFPKVLTFFARECGEAQARSTLKQKRLYRHGVGRRVWTVSQPSLVYLTYRLNWADWFT